LLQEIAVHIGRTLIAIAAAAAIPTLASAIPISAGSQLNIAGFDVGIGTTTTINLATGLDFTTAAAPTTPSPGVAGTLTSVSGTGGFSGINCVAACGTIQDIANFATFAAINNFYTTTAGVSFDLLTLAAPIRIAPGPSQLATLIIGGTGTFHQAGFDPTPGIFTLTTQGGSNTTFSASTIAQATPTPEPASLALVGAGLFGLAAARRRRG
jgi:hypothetical protein